MGYTLSEKIIAKAAGRPELHADDIVWVDVDKAMLDDILGPKLEIADRLKEMGVPVKDPSKVVVISDHLTPPANTNQANIVKFTRDWAKEYGVENYYEFCGPCHQIMVENAHVLPGELVLGTDSHTCTYGALASFATGVGSTEMAGVLATGQTWLKVPKTILARWNGKLPEGVMAKDVSLKTIGTVGHSGATYMTLEYAGAVIKAMPIDERLCLSNMAVEAGAKAGLIGYDDETARYLAERGVTERFDWCNSDEDANFLKVLDFSADELVPQIACPHEVDNVFSAREVSGTKINQAYIGSCTGGRLSDLTAAAKLLKGKKVAPGIRLLVSPASKSIYNECLANGTLQTLAEAGAVILPATCGACLGAHSGLLADGEVCISATNRNFLGRMGSETSKLYLGSPLSVAAAAVKGEICDPRELL